MKLHKALDFGSGLFLCDSSHLSCIQRRCSASYSMRRLVCVLPVLGLLIFHEGVRAQDAVARA